MRTWTLYICAMLSTAACGAETSELFDPTVETPPYGNPFVPPPAEPGVLLIRTVSEYNPAIPVDNAIVKVDDGPWTPVDADGYVRVPDPGRPYTVQIYQTLTSDLGTRFDDVWVRRDLTDNPLVQRLDGTHVDNPPCNISGRVRNQSSRSTVHVAGISSADSTDRGGAFTVAHDVVPGRAILRATEIDSNGHVIAYGTAQTTIDASPPCDRGGVDILIGPVERRSVQVEVTVPPMAASAPVSTHAFVTFVEGTRIFTDSTTGERSPSLEYFMVGTGTPNVFARVETEVTDTTPEPNFSFQPRGALFLAFRDFDSSESELRLDMVATSTLVAPNHRATVDAPPIFEWREDRTTGKAYLSVDCGGTKPDGKMFWINYRRIDATGGRAELPAIDGVTFPSGTTCLWSVVYQEEDASARSFVSAETATRRIDFR